MNLRSGKLEPYYSGPMLVSLILILILVVLAIQGYVSQPNVASQNDYVGLMPTYEPCDAPCWNGIIPGKSTDKEVEVVVGKLPGYKRTVWSFSDGDEVEYVWDSGSMSEVGSENVIRTKSGIVKEISIYIATANLTLQDIVSKYGPPEKMDWLSSVRHATYQEDGRLETGLVQLGFYYFTKGLNFSTDWGQADEPEADMKVVNSLYTVPTTWEAYSSKIVGGHFMDWDGFNK